MIDEPLNTAVVPARSQGGVLRHRQALDAGLSPRRIRDLVARGDWQLVLEKTSRDRAVTLMVDAVATVLAAASVLGA